MIKNFLSGIYTGLNSNPVVKYSAMVLVALLIVMKITKWWAEFRKKV